MDKILILDFGSSTTQLLGARIRELGVYSEIIPGDTPLNDGILGGPGTIGTVRGIILSGSPEAAYAEGSPVPDKRVYSSGLPLLGICYGLQRMTQDNGGRVEAMSMSQKEIGGSVVKGRFPAVSDSLADIERARRFFAAFDKTLSLEDIRKGALPSSGEWSINSWMHHGDELKSLAPGFKQFGVSAAGSPSVLIHESKPWFGVQFHPEVADCERGKEVLAAFVFGAAGCSADWTMEQYAEEACSAIAEKAGKNPVLLLISGGVDSSVVGALLLKALPPDQVHLMYMDTGLMRKDETKSVSAALERLGAKQLHIIHCENEFLSALKGVTDPETKRKTIGDLFIKVQERETARLGLPDSYLLAQGTIYPDIIESGKGMSGKAKVVKSHHNVGSPLVDAKRSSGRVIEPLERLFKEEVRALGRFLGLDGELIKRHPFPGPGLAVRVLGEVSREKCDILREADAVFIEELKKRKGDSGKSLYDEIWQAFAVLLPVRSVGVSGGSRRYGWVLALRAINSSDAMTAEVYPFRMKDLLEISGRITDTVKDIGRVSYDISGKPPATIEWE